MDRFDKDKRCLIVYKNWSPSLPMRSCSSGVAPYYSPPRDIIGTNVWFGNKKKKALNMGLILRCVFI